MPYQMEQLNSLIMLRGLSKSYREGSTERSIFSDLTFSLPNPYAAAIIGRSGSGKSTLLNLLSGIDLPDSGEIEVLGFSVSAATEKERTLFRRRKIGFLFQFFNLIPVLTVWDNILLPLSLNSKNDKTSLARAEHLLDRVGLFDRRFAYPDHLSGGEQQRVALVRSLVHDPELLLADEPTGNLDEKNATIVLEALSSLLREERKSLIMVTHSREALGIAEGVFTMENQSLVKSS